MTKNQCFKLLSARIPGLFHLQKDDYGTPFPRHHCVVLVLLKDFAVFKQTVDKLGLVFEPMTKKKHHKGYYYSVSGFEAFTFEALAS